MTDYMQKARDLVQASVKGAIGYSTAATNQLAHTLEALDTERTRADEAEKRERELREAVEAETRAKVWREAWDTARGSNADLCRDNGAAYRLIVQVLKEKADKADIALRTLIQPEADPLVEAIEAMRQTAKELRECPNRDCNLVMQAIMWEKRAADVEARLSIVKGES